MAPTCGSRRIGAGGPQSLLRAHSPPGAPRSRPPSQTGRVGLGAAPIAQDFGLCLLPGAHRVSGTERGQLSTGGGGGGCCRRQRGASHTGCSRLTGRLPLRSGAPLAAGGPDATGDAPIACQLPEPGPVDSGRWAQDSTPPTHTPQAGLPPLSGSVECACAEPAAWRSLPCQILLWRAAPNSAGGSRQPRLGSCPELPAPPRS